MLTAPRARVINGTLRDQHISPILSVGRGHGERWSRDFVRLHGPVDGFKTVELIVAERDWQPPRPCLAPDRPISLRIAFAEVDLRRRVKQAGGRWNSDERVWQLPHDRAVALGLTERIVDTSASSIGCVAPTGGHLHADA